MKTTLVLIVSLLAPVVGLHAASNGMTQLASLSFGAMDPPDSRLSQSQACAQLKSIALLRCAEGCPGETQARLKALLNKIRVRSTL